MPASQGLSAEDRPVIVGKAWTTDGQGNAVPVMAETLTEEQLRQSCKYLPDVQVWTDHAASALAADKPIMSPQTWGTKVHYQVKQAVEALRVLSPEAQTKLWAELSLASQADNPAYGLPGSTRLDILEDRRAEMGAVCVYDVKTGMAGLTLRRVKEIADLVRLRYGEGLFFIIEIRPSQ